MYGLPAGRTESRQLDYHFCSDASTVIASTKARFLRYRSCGCCICRAVSRATRTLDLVLILLAFLVFSILRQNGSLKKKGKEHVWKRRWSSRLDQRLANGGIPLIATGAFLTEEWEYGLWMFGAAVSVAAADTFASEFGCLDDNVRMITTSRNANQE